MIIVQIGRGLGNSMYTYAAALALAKHHKTDLKIDTSYLNSWPRWEKYGGAWEAEITKLNISAEEARGKEVIQHLIRTGFRPLDRVIERFRLFEKRVHRFPTSGSLNDFYNLPDNIYLKGYLGNEKFFEPVKDKIKKEFTLKEEHKKKIKPLLKKISKENSVSIHVRRGDVLKLKNAYILPLDYYEKAINLIKKKVKNPRFYIFSDEIKWCKKNFKKFNIKMNFIEGNMGWEDLELMRNCKHNILAVSALSWWAGYLNPNKKKIVIAPKHFSHFKHAKIEPDYLPEDWIKM